MTDYFIVDSAFNAFISESNSSVLSLNPEVNTPAEIDRTFEIVTYNKGDTNTYGFLESITNKTHLSIFITIFFIGSVMIYMLQNILSEKVFQVGVQKFLQTQ